MENKLHRAMTKPTDGYPSEDRSIHMAFSSLWAISQKGRKCHMDTYVYTEYPNGPHDKISQWTGEADRLGNITQTDLNLHCGHISLAFQCGG